MKASVKLRAYEIISRAVEEGVGYGIARAFKYSDAPDRDSLAEQVELAVMNALCDVLEFE